VREVSVAGSAGPIGGFGSKGKGFGDKDEASDDEARGRGREIRRVSMIGGVNSEASHGLRGESVEVSMSDKEMNARGEG
jgi:hypothetical protein